jgi:hypothetical protein
MKKTSVQTGDDGMSEERKEKKMCHIVDENFGFTYHQ